MALLSCGNCGKEFDVRPARIHVARFCSYRCRADWQAKNKVFAKENNPNYRGGFSRNCALCEKEFWVRPSIGHQKFCSKACADKGGFRYSGKDHPNYREDARRKNRGGSHHKWVNAVIGRDMATCRHCGAREVELHAHHIKSYKDHPELRFDVSNGLTLCYKCHWEVHAASNENAVNSVDPRTGKAEGNTEPSNERKPVEGVTTRGRAYRRWFGSCEFCNTPISKRWSDVTGKNHMFCSKSCSAKFRVRAVNASTSAARESEDIV